MPQRTLQQIEQGIAKELRRNTLLSGFLTLTGFTLLIPAFSLEGTRFDYQQFCFKPEIVYSSDSEFCTGNKIRNGIAWRVALELNRNQQFKDKVTLLKTIPAQQPNAGLYGLCAAAFFGSSFFFFKSGTERLEDNLDVVVSNKKALVFERGLLQSKHQALEELRVQQEQEFLKEMMNRDHGGAMYELLSDGERTIAGDKMAKSEQLDAASFDLQVAEMKAQTAERLEKEAKHKLETEKLTKSQSSVVSRQPSAATPNEVAKSELTEKLKNHEGGWLHTLVYSNKPIFLIGSQGSWKSYAAGTIALARYYLKGQKVASIVDPHLNKNQDESWKELIRLEPETYGAFQDWADVREGIQAGFERWNKRTLKDEPLTSIWDEQTNWALHEECAKSSEEFMGRVISDPRKSNEGVLVITHSFTNKGTGGGGGFAQAREEGVIQLRLNSDNEMKPLFKGKLLGFKDDEGELIEDMKVTIPKDWFNPTAIRKMFEGK